MLAPLNNQLVPNNFGIYIHVPFCRFKCGYCDFCALQIGHKTNPYLLNYHEYIIKELELYRNILRNNSITSLYFGGGTPSLLQVEQIKSIYSYLNNICSFSSEFSFEMESNPDDLNAQYIDDLSKIGVQRLSIGVQSFQPQVLKTLERQHSLQAVVEAVTLAKQQKLMVNIDLIYGTPGETLEMWRNTLEQAINLKPDHISAYALTLEANVRLSKMIQRLKLKPVDEDFQAIEYQLADEILSANGYTWYEISNWVQANWNQTNGHSQSQHNLNYWKNGNWLGVGPSSHSHFTSTINHGELLWQRFWNVSNVLQYVKMVDNKQRPISGDEVISSIAHAFEQIMLACRLNQPLEVANFPNISKFKLRIQQLIDDGLVENSTHTLTIKGRLLNDEVVRRLTDEQLTDDPNNTYTCPRYQTAKCCACPTCIVE